jgi:hypothetical protein
MGHRGDGADRPYCREDGCGRRAYVDDLCHVCDGASHKKWATKMLRGSPARQSSAPLQDFLDNPALAKLCMEFVHGDGWEWQCHCTRCPRPWLNAGWVCPVEYQRRTYLQELDRIFTMAGYTTPELCYVDWDVAVLWLHDMETDEIPGDIRILVEFARASSQRVNEELREMHLHERFLDEMFPDEIPLDVGPPGAP